MENEVIERAVEVWRDIEKAVDGSLTKHASHMETYRRIGERVVTVY